MLSITPPVNRRWPVRGIRSGRAFVQAGALASYAAGSSLLMRLLWAAALGLPVFGAQGGVFFTSLYSFGVSTNGVNPNGLVQASDGNFYGTSGGGTEGAGTVFRISTNGTLTSLYSFTGANDGAYPNALVQGSDGDLYGTTSSGGTSNYGTVFKISTNGTLTTLHSFTGTNDGAFPYAELAQGSDGNLYGTTSASGMDQSTGATYGAGTVFKISANGALMTLHSFTGTNDGANPYAGLVQGSDGNFYGTTRYGPGGPFSGFGTVFKITTEGALTTLYSFTGGKPEGAYPPGGPYPPEGAYPYGLVQGADGNFYGTTQAGSRFSVRGGWGPGVEFGTVFRISTNGVLTTLYSFGFAGYNDGGNPAGGLVHGSDGNFYGTTGGGTVFKISTNGALTSLYSFTGGNDGAYPNALVQGSDGNLYGTTSSGGTNGGHGTVFKFGTNGVLSSLYSFTAANDGANPRAALVQGSDGSFYGTTGSGGTNGAGTVFKINADGALTTLHSFNGANDGAAPNGLAQGSDGNLYGTTSDGGTNGWGTVFKISTNGALTILHSFSGKDGGGPNGLVQANDGNFYDTTEGGGTYGDGTVFRIATNGALTTLYSFAFAGYSGGGGPVGGLVHGSDGDFYGATVGGGTHGAGTVFKISTDGWLAFLYSFGGGPYYNGSVNPVGALIQGSDGCFYGTTQSGGTYGAGTVFKISTNRVLTSLYSFTGGNDGQDPVSGLVQASDGILYGTTAGGGTHGAGTVFKISTNGAYTALYSFTGGHNGANPNAGLVQGRDGSFYGTTSVGGPGGVGTIFRLTVVRVAPVLEAVPLDDGWLLLTWGTEPGEKYQLQFSSDLSSSNWANVGGPLTATGATLGVIDPLSLNSITSLARRFYRVALLP